MATATGWGALPISMSFGDSIKELVAELNGPVAQAAKNAAGSIEKEIGTASQKAADRYEKQKWRMEKASKEHTAAEEQHRLKLLEQEKAQTALENAEKDLAEAREQGGKKARDAQLRYENAQIKVEKATIATRKASDQLESATVEVSKATESAEQAFKDMENAQDDAGDSAKSFRDLVREMGQELDETGEKASSFGDKVVSGLGTIGKGALLGVGAKIGTTVMSGVGTAFSKGFGRLQSLEDAEASLQGLGRSSEDIDNIMDSVSQSVTGTAFGLDEAAKSAATFSTLGVKSGEEMDRVMSLLADTTAQSGAELSEISPIMNKIVAAGGLNIETYDQLNERATGVGEALSKHLGIPIEEVRDNLEDVDFETFATAMENNIGGAAKKSGETFGNAFGNMQAALGRLGEKFLAPAFEMGPAVFGAMGGAFDKLGEELEPVIEQVTEYLTPIMDDFAERLGPWLEETIENVSQAVKDSVGWIRENADWLKAMAVGVGIAVGAWKLFTGAIKLHGIAIAIADKGWKGYIASTKIATAVTKLFNKATKANIIGIIATALIAVGGALVYFFTKTETGRELWEKFTGALGNGWDWVTEKFSEGIRWITEKWDEFTTGFSEAWESIKTAVFDAWTSTIENIQGGWETFTGAISTAWTATKDTFVNVWNGIKQAVFDVFIWYINRVKANFELVTGAINTAWTWLKDGLAAVWTYIRDTVLNAFNYHVNRIKTVFESVAGAINAKWTWLKDMLLSVWNNIKELVLTAFNNAIQNVQNIFDRVTGAISNAWTWLKDQLHAGWTWIKENVFDAIGRGLDTVKGWFRDGVDGIGRIWDGLKDAAKKPVKFVVDTVWNNGLLKAINAVTGFIGMDDIQPIDIGFARGGILPGWSRMADGDNRLVPMRDGEGVLVSEGLRDNTSRSMFLAANEHAKRGGSFASFVSEMGAGYATGGIINLAGALSRVQESHARFVAKFFPDLFALTSASRSEPGSFHDYGAQKATDWQAQDGQYATQMPTPNSKALARAIYTNFPNSAELIHWPLDGWQNLDEGRPHDFGAGTNAGHANHVHWATHSPLQFDGDDIVLSDAPGGGSDGSFVKRIWDGIVDKINPYDDAGNGWFSEVPGAFVKSAAGKLWDFVSEKVKSIFTFVGGGDASQWSDLALIALKKFGYGEEHLPAMLQQIQIESGSNPNAVNMWDENAVRGTPSGGLLQVIEPTYRRVRNAYPDAFEGLPDDRMEPITNLTAGVGAVKMDWGGPAGRWPTRDGYADGGIVDLPKLFDKGGVWPDGTMGVNLSGSDEVVFNNRQWQLLKQVLNTVPMLTESQEMMVKEIGAAFLGTDIGYAELANALGSEKMAQQVTDIAFLLGDISRDTEVMAAAQEFQEQTRQSAEDYASEQASGVLSIFGLEGLVPLGLKAGEKAAEAYAANPVDVAMSPNGLSLTARTFGVQADMSRRGATVVIEAESDDDLIRVKQFKKLAEQVDGLEVQVKRKPKAAVRTRGGVM